jgi:uncharacterized protein YbjT (DUF2867 family)
VTAPILVTGGTGILGRHVVSLLREAGHEIRVLSRRHNPSVQGIEFVAGDLAKGDGIERAVQGAEMVLHLAGTSKGDDVKAQHLVRAALRVGRPHLVYISVVGADRIPIVSAVDRAMFGYFGSKHAAERIFAESSLPWTTVRATQFHDPILMTARQMSRMPVIPVPSGFRFQPIDIAEVAARLVELALGNPAGRVPDMAGPRVYPMKDLVRSYLKAHRKHRALLSLKLPGKAARAFRDGANLASDRAVGLRTWEDFLATEVNPPRKIDADRSRSLARSA